MTQKIRSFTNLEAWQQAHKLTVQIYKQTNSFPKSENFGLTNQIRRSAVSVASNIAEGFSRNTKADKKHFNLVAKGSVNEVQSQLLIARDVGYIKNEEFEILSQQSVRVHKLLTGLMKSLDNGNGIKA